MGWAGECGGRCRCSAAQSMRCRHMAAAALLLYASDSVIQRLSEVASASRAPEGSPGSPWKAGSTAPWLAADRVERRWGIRSQLCGHLGLTWQQPAAHHRLLTRPGQGRHTRGPSFAVALGRAHPGPAEPLACGGEGGKGTARRGGLAEGLGGCTLGLRSSSGAAGPGGRGPRRAGGDRRGVRKVVTGLGVSGSGAGGGWVNPSRAATWPEAGAGGAQAVRSKQVTRRGGSWRYDGKSVQW